MASQIFLGLPSLLRIGFEMLLSNGRMSVVCPNLRELTLQFAHIDEDSPRLNGVSQNGGKGSKISRIWYVDSDRPVLDSWRQKNTEPPAQA